MMFAILGVPAFHINLRGQPMNFKTTGAALIAAVSVLAGCQSVQATEWGGTSIGYRYVSNYLNVDLLQSDSVDSSA